MKFRGIVKEFDGYNGTIISNNIEFLVTKNNIISNIKPGDVVLFTPEIRKTDEIEIYFATFVEVIIDKK